MTILRVGSTEKYADNWAKAFGEKPAKSGKSGASKKSSDSKTGAKASAKKADSKKSPNKKAVRK